MVNWTCGWSAHGALESAEAIDTAISLFDSTEADFADCLLCAKAARIGCEALLTFDKGMKTLPGVGIVS